MDIRSSSNSGVAIVWIGQYCISGRIDNNVTSASSHSVPSKSSNTRRNTGSSSSNSGGSSSMKMEDDTDNNNMIVAIQQGEENHPPLLLASTEKLLHLLQEHPRLTHHDRTTTSKQEPQEEETTEATPKQQEEEEEEVLDSAAALPTTDNTKVENDDDDDDAMLEDLTPPEAAVAETAEAASSEDKNNDKPHDDNSTAAAAHHLEAETQEGANDNEEGANDDDDDNDNRLLYQSLVRIHKNKLPDAIVIALNDIRIFRQRDDSNVNKTPKGQPRLNHQQRRIQALTHQRDRLLQQQQQSNGASNTAQDEHKESSCSSLFDDEWNLLIAAMNSLRILTPILLDMLLHKHRNDQDLNIGGETLRELNKNSNTDSPNMNQKKKKAPKPKCWFLGRYVYDTISNKHCKSILKQLQELYFFLGTTTNTTTCGDKTSTIDDNDDTFPITTTWKTILDHATNQIRTLLMERHSSASNLESRSSCYSWMTLHIPAKVENDNTDGSNNSSHSSLALSNAGLDQEFGLNFDKDESEHQRYLQSIHNLQRRLAGFMTYIFPQSRLSIYGSCLSDLSLGHNADVDLSLHVPQLAHDKRIYESGGMSVEDYQRNLKKDVYRVFHTLQNRSNEFSHMQPVARARVPVVRGTHILARNPHTPNGTLDFDICFLNDIAVANSELLRQYSLIDVRVKHLMVTVKKWAKSQHISTAQDNCLSSYAWMNLVIFYLQNIDMVPNLQCPRLMEQIGGNRDESNEWHNVNQLHTFFLLWEQVAPVWRGPPEALRNINVTALLYGFFDFYANRFPTQFSIISIRLGKSAYEFPKTVFHKSSLFWCIEDPFETYDSYCPHDLGIPANELGSRKIIKCLRDAEMHLKKALQEIIDHGKTTARTLWPVEPSSATKDTGRVRQKHGFSGQKKKKNSRAKGGIAANEKRGQARKGSGNDSSNAEQGGGAVTTGNGSKAAAKPGGPSRKGDSQPVSETKQQTSSTGNGKSPTDRTHTNGEGKPEGRQKLPDKRKNRQGKKNSANKPHADANRAGKGEATTTEEGRPADSKTGGSNAKKSGHYPRRRRNNKNRNRPSGQQEGGPHGAKSQPARVSDQPSKVSTTVGNSP